MATCLQCDKVITSKSALKFCNRSCSATYNNTGRVSSQAKKDAISAALSGRVGHSSNVGKLKVERIERECINCKTVFKTTKARNKLICSIDCWKANAGGAREGSGRSKSGYYQGIYCGSTYELAWVIYQLDHNLPFERFPGYVECSASGQRYYPDFIQNGIIVELKGYERSNTVDVKTKIANAAGYQVLVKRKEDLQTEFDWCKTNYKYVDLYELYDGYKPKYVYTCYECNITFQRKTKLKTSIGYCSRECCCKGNQKNRHNAK